MKKHQKHNGRPETGGKPKTNPLIEGLKKMLSNLEDPQQADALCTALERTILHQARKIPWPSQTIKEDVMAIVLYELVTDTIPKDQRGREMLATKKQQSLVPRRLRALVKRRLRSRCIDMIRKRQRDGTVPLQSLLTEPRSPAAPRKEPDPDEALKILGDPSRLANTRAEDRKLVAKMLETGKPSIRQASDSIGISRHKAQRSIERIRPSLRMEMDM